MSAPLLDALLSFELRAPLPGEECAGWFTRLGIVAPAAAATTAAVKRPLWKRR